MIKLSNLVGKSYNLFFKGENLDGESVRGTVISKKVYNPQYKRTDNQYYFVTNKVRVQLTLKGENRVRKRRAYENNLFIDMTFKDFQRFLEQQSL